MNKIRTIMMTAGAACLLFLVFACNTMKKFTAPVPKVPYTVAQNYFFINHEPLPEDHYAERIRPYVRHGRTHGRRRHPHTGKLQTPVRYRSCFAHHQPQYRAHTVRPFGKWRHAYVYLSRAGGRRNDVVYATYAPYRGRQKIRKGARKAR